MTQAIAKYAAKKMLSKEMDKYKSKKVGGQYDPFYEEIPHPRNPNKTKKVKRQIPAYIPPHDANILAKARKSAYRLDLCLFNFLGFRFGWSSVIGLVPAIGDALDAFFALLLIKKMMKVECKLPKKLIGMMLFNMVIDFFVGLVPFVGDLADAAMKANCKNVRLLEKHLDDVYKPRELIDAEEKRGKRMSRTPATIYEDFSDEEDERRRAFSDSEESLRQPARAYTGRRGDRIRDEEMGYPSRSDTHRSHRDRDVPSRHNTRGSRRH